MPFLNCVLMWWLILCKNTLFARLPFSLPKPLWSMMHASHSYTIIHLLSSHPHVHPSIHNFGYQSLDFWLLIFCCSYYLPIFRLNRQHSMECDSIDLTIRPSIHPPSICPSIHSPICPSIRRHMITFHWHISVPTWYIHMSIIRSHHYLLTSRIS